jgi:hypothetical protein
VSGLVAFRRNAALVWNPAEGDAIPVHRPQDLEAHLSAWRDYGNAATIRQQSRNDREVTVTALGRDGWLVAVHDVTMLTSGWHRHKILTRLRADGSLPGLFGDSLWYIPDESSDLAGSVLIAEQIQFDPVPVAQAVWAWLTATRMPSGYAAGIVGYQPVVANSITEALAWIANTTGPAWSTDATSATSELAEELCVDRIVVTSPGQILLRVPNTARRVRVQYRVKSEDAQVRVVGLTDALGHEYSIDLPGRQNIRISRRRSR